MTFDQWLEQNRKLLGTLDDLTILRLRLAFAAGERAAMEEARELFVGVLK